MESSRRRDRQWRSGLALAGSLTVLTVAMFAGISGVLQAATLRDAAGRAVTITDPNRIVSIGGAITEILYALGLGDRIVAVDTTSVYPPRALAEKPNVGYMRQLSPEGVLSLTPSVILASEGAGPKTTITVLESAAVPFVLVPEHFTGDGILEKIRLVTAATSAETRGRCLAEAVAADLEALAKLRARIAKPKRVLFMLSFVNGRPMVAGRSTAADGIIKLAGGVNAIDAYEGYKPVNDEAVITAKPDAVLAMERKGHTIDAATLFASPAFALTPAASNRAFISMDGLYLLGFGPRTARAARDLAVRLYPELGEAALPSEQNEALKACAT
jgi:iron complex transport system substrate-binding protein